MADQSGGSSAVTTPPPPLTGMREYRKGNWTLQDTMILIEAKKMDDERRLKKSPQVIMPSTITTTPGSSSSTSQQQEQMLTMMQTTTTSSTKPVTELRWKWVEDYCWKRGCFRSQNQCNDKWDNLMRDYKKVRDYQRNLITNAQHQHQQGLHQSYWNMEKSERKERNLPSNMLPTIYDALLQVVENKPSTSSPASALLPPALPVATTTTSGALSLLLLQQQQQQQQQQVNVAALSLPRTPQFSPHQQMISPTLSTIPGDHGVLLDSDTSSGSPAKRRKKEKIPGTTTTRVGAGVGPSSSSKNEASDIASVMCRIVEAIQESNKRQDERHREMVALKQRRLQIEEASVEVNKQGMNVLVDAVNNLASSILALATANNNGNGQQPPQPPPPPH